MPFGNPSIFHGLGRIQGENSPKSSDLISGGYKSSHKYRSAAVSSWTSRSGWRISLVFESAAAGPWDTAALRSLFMSCVLERGSAATGTVVRSISSAARRNELTHISRINQHPRSAVQSIICSNFVDGGVCQLLSPLRKVGKKNREKNGTKSYCPLDKN